MKKYKLTTQKIIFGGNDIITDVNRTESRIIDAIDCKENYDVTIITDKNIDRAKPLGYELGDEIKILRSITFIKNDINLNETINLLVGDPYYKVEVEYENSYNIVYKHKCQ